MSRRKEHHLAWPLDQSSAVRDGSRNTDHYAWLCGQAKAIREEAFVELNREMLAAEIDKLARNTKDQAGEHLTNLILETLKYQHVPKFRTKWIADEIVILQVLLEAAFKESPTLVGIFRQNIASFYDRAIVRSSMTRGLRFQKYGPCPYSLDQIMDDQFCLRRSSPFARNRRRRSRSTFPDSRTANVRKNGSGP